MEAGRPGAEKRESGPCGRNETGREKTTRIEKKEKEGEIEGSGKRGFEGTKKRTSRMTEVEQIASLLIVSFPRVNNERTYIPFIAIK